jgi:hypothetical protein
MPVAALASTPRLSSSAALTLAERPQSLAKRKSAPSPVGDETCGGAVGRVPRAPPLAAVRLRSRFDPVRARRLDGGVVDQRFDRLRVREHDRAR